MISADVGLKLDNVSIDLLGRAHPRVRARIVMPENSARTKFEAVRSYGGELLLCEPTLAAREGRVRAVT